MVIKASRKSKYKFRVGRSNAGLGLFTCESIRRDSFVIEYFGPLLNEATAEKKGGKYLFQISKKWDIDGTSRKNMARYLNHSCKPNCEAELDGKRVFIYAIKNIKTGEELTYHYGKEYFNDLIKPRGCRCGACTQKR